MSNSSKSNRSSDKCFACRQPLNTSASRWLIQTSNTSTLRLCGECADQIASRDGAPQLINVS